MDINFKYGSIISKNLGLFGRHLVAVFKFLIAVLLVGYPVCIYIYIYIITIKFRLKNIFAEHIEQLKEDVSRIITHDGESSKRKKSASSSRWFRKS